MASRPSRCPSLRFHIEHQIGRRQLVREIEHGVAHQDVIIEIEDVEPDDEIGLAQALDQIVDARFVERFRSGQLRVL